MKKGLPIFGRNFKDEKELKYYKCYWPGCTTEFYHWVRKYGGQGTGKHNTVSTPVRCPKCNNGLKTWREYE